MQAMEIVGGYTTGDTTAVTGVTLKTGNSLTIRNAPFDSKVYLLSLWTKYQVAGEGRLRSPRMHDNVRGINWSVGANDSQPVISPYFPQILVPQDTLVLETDGGGAAGDVAITDFLVYYENLPGVSARLVDPDYVRQHGKHVIMVENNIATAATGDWGGEEAINAEVDLMKANTDYALIGYTVDVECASVRWRGVDTGNLGVGGPGYVDNKDLTVNWFVRLSMASGLPCIPVFNSANKAGILVDASQDEAGTDVILHSIFVELE
jgi:hypothetical protein